jgi:multiple antibiotic resistance protein
MDMAQIIVTLFLIIDPIGNVPAFVSILKNFDPSQQRRIILRELIIALAVILIFNFSGRQILSLIGISYSTVLLAGGLILFLIALQMIFPQTHHESAIPKIDEPFIVPLAIPLIAGPSVISTVMVYSAKPNTGVKTTIAIFIAWFLSAIILLSSSIIKKYVDYRILIALERLMGLIMTIFAVNMFNQGLALLFS